MLPLFAELNRGQMSKGKASNDDKITYGGKDHYSAAYAKVKGRTTPIDLKKTGLFHKGVYADVRAQEIHLSSTDSKTDKLVEKSGDIIFGLTEDSKDQAREKGMEILTDKIKNKLK